MVLSSALFACNAAYGAEPNYLTHDSPVEDSVLDNKGIIGEGSPTPAKAARRPILTLPEGLAPFWRDTSLDLKPRIYHFDRERDETADSQALSAGGALEYRSGQLWDRVSVGATLHTTQKIHGPKDKPGSGLLKPVQQGFTVLGEAFLNVRVAEQAHLRLFRQSFNLPYVNKNDGRMIPNFHEAATLLNNEDPIFNYVLGHVSKIKKRDFDDFIHLSEAAGAKGTDKGLSMAGARFAFAEEANIGAINQYSWDVFNTFFAEANGAWEVTDNIAVRLSGQFTDQRSVGDELVGSFDTYNVSLKSAASIGGGVLTLAYSHTDDNAGIRSPYGGYPGYTSIIVKDFNRADEDAWLIGLSYDFANIGWDGVSGFFNYAFGDTPESGAAASPDQDEFDFTLDYRPPQGFFDGFWLRARVAFLDEHGAGANDIEDYRLILNYTVPLL